MTKATNLEKLDSIGVSVPPFKIFNVVDVSTKKEFSKVFRDWLEDNIASEYTGKFSVRSSGSVSTPGRMRTYLSVKNSLYMLTEAGTKVYKSSKGSTVLSYLELKGVKDFKLDIVIQAMVYGDSTDTSCSGVLVTRDPITNEDSLYGEIRFNSVGEGLMSGKVTPEPLINLREVNPKGYNDLVKQVEKIKSHYQSPQEIEFVVEGEKAWILQTRDYKWVQTFLLDFDHNNLIAKGRAATPISTIGRITYSKDSINADSIYISRETDWEDTADILKGRGVITVNGGSLSHAAIIAREFELPCITGIGEESLELLPEAMTIGMDSNGGIYEME
ncbi:MAG: PEP/pyruvate-binding domain-containing protein [Elainellaceae cyanobacterium]